MLAKPLTFLLVFLLTLINFIVLFVPISLLFFPFLLIFKSLIIKDWPNLLLFIISHLSGAMIAYIVFDTVFGITMRRMHKGCINFKKATVIYGHKEIMESFEWLKDKFKIKNVKLYLDPSITTVNAYAIGSFSGSIVTITMGLINQMHQKSQNQDDFIDAIRGILGHEMSHLTNQDFLPGMLVNASGAACDVVSKIVRIIFVVLAKIFKLVPWFGPPIAELLISSYNFVNYLINMFFKLAFMPIYNFMMNFFGRSIEYRCDRDSAYAYGGIKMAKALQLLAAKGYFSLFSTHPTTKSRVSRVQKILPKDGYIRPTIINKLSNFLSLVLITFICIYSSSLTNTPDLYNHFMKEVYYPVKYKHDKYQADFMQFYYKYKHLLGK